MAIKCKSKPTKGQPEVRTIKYSCKPFNGNFAKAHKHISYHKPTEQTFTIFMSYSYNTKNF